MYSYKYEFFCNGAFGEFFFSYCAFVLCIGFSPCSLAHFSKCVFSGISLYNFSFLRSMSLKANIDSFFLFLLDKRNTLLEMNKYNFQRRVLGQIFQSARDD
jgi:hypothetical protein